MSMIGFARVCGISCRGVLWDAHRVRYVGDASHSTADLGTLPGKRLDLHVSTKVNNYNVVCDTALSLALAAITAPSRTT